MKPRLTAAERKMLAEVRRLQRAGRMPTLEQWCAAVLEVRKEYRLQILRARREAKAESHGV